MALEDSFDRQWRLAGREENVVGEAVVLVWNEVTVVEHLQAEDVDDHSYALLLFITVGLTLVLIKIRTLFQGNDFFLRVHVASHLTPRQVRHLFTR